MNSIARYSMEQPGICGILLLTASVALLISASCTIIDTEEPAWGAIRISAVDTVSGVAIEGAAIVLDGVPRVEVTPELLNGVAEGGHTVEVRPGGNYSSSTLEVMVVPPDTSELIFLFATIDARSAHDNGTIFVTTDSDPAYVLVDERFHEMTVTPASFFLPPGNYMLSVYREGYRTLSPAGISFESVAGDTETFDFSLQLATTGSDVGKLVPDFNLPTDQGDTLAIAQFRGRVVLVNFWFYNCTPCREEFPAIQQIFSERAEEGFRILSINTGWYNDGPGEFAAIRRELRVTFPLLFNTIGIDFTQETFAVVSAPTNILVDEEGVVRFRFGVTNYNDLNEKLDSLLP